MAEQVDTVAVETPEWLSPDRYTPSQRRRAGALLRQHAPAVLKRWHDGLSEPFRAVAEPGRTKVVERLLGFYPLLLAGIADPADTRSIDELRHLARDADEFSVPDSSISRGLRILKRVCMRLFAAELADDPELAVLCDLVEDDIDEHRLRVNRFYHLIAERRVRDSEQLTRFLLNNTLDAIFLVDVETARIDMVNAIAVRMTGYPSESLVGSNFLDLAGDERVDAVADALRRVIVSHTYRLDQVPLKAAEGPPMPTVMQFVMVRYDGAKRIAQVSVRDTSHETAAMAAQAKEAAYLRAFVADTVDAVMVLDTEDRIRSWNTGAEVAFGYAADEVLNRHVGMLLPPMQLAGGELEELAERVARDGIVRDHETQRLRRDGTVIDCNLTRTAIFDHQTGEWIGCTAVVRDVTERRRLERETERKSRQLEVMNRILESTSRSLDREQTFRAIAEQMEGLQQFDAMTISFPDRARQALRVRVLAGDGSLRTGREESIARAASVRARVLASREPVRISDLATLSEPGEDDRRLVELGFASMLITPLIYNDEVVGTVELLHRGVEAYSAEDQAQFQHLGGHFAVILENARRYEEERKRALQFELISRVGASAIANIGDVRRLLQNLVETIQRDLDYHDVAYYEYDEEIRSFRLTAQAGARRASFGRGYTQAAEVGIMGEVLRTQQSYLTTDVAADSLYYDPEPAVGTVRSELCVPVRLGPRVFGVLDLESDQPAGFDAVDASAMEALSGLLARWMEADENLRHTRMLQAMRHNIMEAVPSALLCLDEAQRVRFVNRRYCEFYGQSVADIMHRPVDEVLPPDLLTHSNFVTLVEELKRTREPIDQREVRYFDFDGQERYCDVRLRIVTEYEVNIVVMLHDATTRMQRIFQLQLLREIGEEMQRTRNIDRLLRAILTCVTAGPGFGFNRASLYLVDREREALVHRMRVGPQTPEEAGEIWREVGSRKSLREFLREYDLQQGDGAVKESSGGEPTLPLPAEEGPLRGWRTPLLLRANEPDAQAPLARRLLELSGAPEVLVVPLVRQSTMLGLIVADNLFTGETIQRSDIRMLTTFANQASLALANVQAYSELEQSLAELREMQEHLSRAEKLAGIGSVAAHVAHEIRNPLVSIGGFARRLQRKAGDADYVASRSEIIVKEVTRLEQILKNVADFTAPGQPELQPTQLNRLIAEVIEHQEPFLDGLAVTVKTNLEPDLPEILGDADKLKQVFLNLVKNACQAMGRGGLLTINSGTIDSGRGVHVEVIDNGPGVPPDRLEEIFNPFFTCRSDGTGLGLAVSRKIIVDHGGTLSASNNRDRGARFVILLPVREQRD